jgi:hypothetical protein
LNGVETGGEFGIAEINVEIARMIEAPSIGA